MIKLGCLVDPAIRQRDRSHTDQFSVEEFVEFAKELRLDTIDFHLFDMPMNANHLSHVKRLCHRNGMPIGYIGAWWRPLRSRDPAGPHDRRDGQA